MPYLKQLELENFKSYAGTTVIGPFDPTVAFTSVIGPNGSGKSNLMDAICFVLGLQANAMRSSQLSELVYRTSKHNGDAEDEQENIDGNKRRPASAWGATVTAVYVDAEGDEHRLQRSINAQGTTSEYRLNGRVVTYGQYCDFLACQNVLIKARNFLVFQGDVEAVASKTPKELLRLFEQLTGSEDLRAEYQRAKEEHERALEISAFAFNKKRQLTTELKTVHEQREAVSEYERLIEQRAALLTEQALCMLFNLEQAATDVGTEIEALERTLAEKQATFTACEGQVGAERKRAAAVQKDVLDAEKKLAKWESSTRGDDGTSATSVALLQRKLKDLAQEMVDVEQEKTMKRQQLGVLSAELASLVPEEENDADAEDVTKLPDYGQRRAAYTEQTAKERVRLESLERQRAPFLFEQRLVEEKLRELDVRQQQCQAEMQQLERELSKCHAQRARLQEQIRQHTAHNTGLQTEQQEEECKVKLRGLSGTLAEAQTDAVERSRQEKLVAMVDALRRIFPKVHGRLVDLVSPLSKRFEIATALVLGRHADSIVVDSECVALECIRYVREQRMGLQATFLPLDTLVIDAAKAPAMHVGARPAVEIFKFSVAHRRAVEFVAQGTIVCDDMSVATHLMNANSSHKLVTVNGQVVHRSGVMTGGAPPRTALKLWQERDLAHLVRQRDELTRDLATLQEQLAALALKRPIDVTDMTEMVDSLNGQSTTLEERLRTLQHECNVVLPTERQQQSKELGLARRELDKLPTVAVRKAMRAIQDKVFGKNYFPQLAHPPILVDGNIWLVEDYEHWQREQRTARQERRSQYEQVRHKLSLQVTYLTEQVSKLDGQVTSLKKEQSMAEADLQREQKENQKEDKVHTKRASMQAAVAEAKARLAEAQGKLADRRKALTDAQRALQEAKRAISTRHCQIEQSLTERVSVLKRCRLESVHVPMLSQGTDFDACLVDYSMLPMAKKGKRRPLNDASHYQNAVAELNEQLAKLEPKLRALDRLDGAEQRISHAIESFEKTRQQAKQARAAFVQIRDQRRRLLLPALRHVAEVIDSIYKQLTRNDAFPEGGTAAIHFHATSDKNGAEGEEEMDEDLLETEGVRFSVQPPSKRFLDMEHLSGGERSIAALALLFALNSYRPAPFFVLDEVDAALDKGNVANLAGYVRWLSQHNSQCLVISLKEDFYRHSDALVGVYKGQVGGGDAGKRQANGRGKGQPPAGAPSSRILSLKLSDYPDD